MELPNLFTLIQNRKMKLYPLFFLFVLAFPALADNSKTVDSRVSQVTLFPEGAQVTRIGHTYLTAGKTELVFSGLSPYADPSSIKVEANGPFAILAVSPQANKLREQKKRKELAETEYSKETFDKQLNLQKAMLDVYQKEEKMLEANYKIGGNNSGLKAEDLRLALDLHRARLKDIKLAELDLDDKIGKLNDTLSMINQQLKALNENKELATTDLVLSVEAREAGNGDFSLSYVVSHAGWYPSYDLHVADINQPLTLNYKANLYQNTGEEWKEVRLTFSNGNPRESGIAPVLSPLYLRNIQARPYQAGAAVPKNAEGARAEEVLNTVSVHKMMSEYLNKDNGNVNYGVATQNATAITFELATPYTVINDGQKRAVEMKQQEIPAAFEYFCVPKKEKKAYLMAHVTNWLDYNLMDGEVNLYYEGTYTGKTAFRLAGAEDTLNISLGHDKGIIINRTQIKDFTKKQILSDKKSVSAAYEILVRNNKKFPVNITVEDQAPVTTDKEISIEDTSFEGGQLEEGSGKVNWKLNVEPGKEKKLNLSYTIKYPKSYHLIMN